MSEPENELDLQMLTNLFCDALNAHEVPPDKAFIVLSNMLAQVWLAGFTIEDNRTAFQNTVMKIYDHVSNTTQDRERVKFVRTLDEKK